MHRATYFARGFRRAHVRISSLTRTVRAPLYRFTARGCGRARSLTARFSVAYEKMCSCQICDTLGLVFLHVFEPTLAFAIQLHHGALSPGLLELHIKCFVCFGSSRILLRILLGKFKHPRIHAGPCTNGAEKERSGRRFVQIPIFVITTSCSARGRQEKTSRGNRQYCCKQPSFISHAGFRQTLACCDIAFEEFDFRQCRISDWYICCYCYITRNVIERVCQSKSSERGSRNSGRKSPVEPHYCAAQFTPRT